MEAAASAVVAIVIVADLVVVVVVATVIALVVVMVRTVGVVVWAVGGLACWMKAGQAAFLAGPCHYPSPTFGNIDPFLYLTPSLRRNKKQLKGVKGKQLCT